MSISKDTPAQDRRLAPPTHVNSVRLPVAGIQSCDVSPKVHTDGERVKNALTGIGPDSPVFVTSLYFTDVRFRISFIYNVDRTHMTVRELSGEKSGRDPVSPGLLDRILLEMVS